MGYTHYWTPKVVTEEKFAEFSKTCKKLHDNLPNTSKTAGGYHSNETIEICGWDGTGKPEFSDVMVSFNGNQDKDLDHETFNVQADKTEWNFCKTARKPYDLLVCACLIAAHEQLDYEVSSDGDLEDWKDAIEFYMDTIKNTKSIFASTKKKLANKILPEFLVNELNGIEED